MRIATGYCKSGFVAKTVRCLVLCAIPLSFVHAVPTAAQQPPTASAAATSSTGSTTGSGFIAPAVVSEAVATNPQQELQRGRDFLRLGQIDAAALALRRVVRTQPTNVQAHEALRQAAIRGNARATLVHTTAALAQLYSDSGAHDKARRRYDELELLAPQHALLPLLASRLGIERTDRASEDGTPSEATQASAAETHWTARARSLLGMLTLLGIAFAFSNNRRKIRPRTILWGLGLQLGLGIFILSAPGRYMFDGVRDVVDKILGFTDAGAGFLFGNLYLGLKGSATSGPLQLFDSTSGEFVNVGLIFAFHILPTIIFFGSLMAILYHFGIIQKLVHGIAWVMRRTMKTSGSESLSAAGNIFVGQTEAPLIIRPYLAHMTQSELMAVMTGGFATVAGGVLAAYVRFGLDAGHLLGATVMSAPAALVIAKIMVPETETSETGDGKLVDPPKTTNNILDAATQGASDGLRLAVNVGAMLMAFIALVALLNAGLGLVGLSLKDIFGTLFYPLSWVMGVDTADLLAFGHLLGTKISINEFVAYVDLGRMSHQLSERTVLIGTYALCGFANFASIGVQIGGISSIAPHRRQDLAKLGLRAMLGGAMASWLTACVAGLLL